MMLCHSITSLIQTVLYIKTKQKKQLQIDFNMPPSFSVTLTFKPQNLISSWPVYMKYVYYKCL